MIVFKYINGSKRPFSHLLSVASFEQQLGHLQLILLRGVHKHHTFVLCLQPYVCSRF